MKHIKKKYLFQQKLTERHNEQLKQVGELIKGSDKSLLKKAKTKDLYFTTDTGFLIRAFPFNYNGKNAVIPIPDLSLVYFDSAYNLNVLRKEKEIELFTKVIINDDKLSEDATNEIYRYYGFASSCIISLFTSLESFVNHIVPDNKLYKKELSHKSEIYNKDQIQKGLSFDEKTKNVLPFFFDNKNFFRHSTLTNQHITNLKNLRNEIVHPKSESSFQSQEKLINELLKFNYDKTLEAVVKFMNFYIPDYISECDCGIDY
tara:strand:- start:962 stop:1741 length:780 start_codon:yes stop_codon:yes gene_type:complete